MILKTYPLSLIFAFLRCAMCVGIQTVMRAVCQCYLSSKVVLTSHSWNAVSRTNRGSMSRSRRRLCVRRVRLRVSCDVLACVRQAHFVHYLNHLHHDNFPASVDSLHRYFDYKSTQKTQASSNTNTNGGVSEAGECWGTCAPFAGPLVYGGHVYILLCDGHCFYSHLCRGSFLHHATAYTCIVKHRISAHSTPRSACAPSPTTNPTPPTSST